MRNAIPLLFGLLFAAGHWPAGATEQVVTRLPTEALPISDYFYQGQKVYDRDGNEIADVNDVLIDKKGKVVAVMIGVGGVLGAGEKNIAIDFEALEVTEKDLEHHLVLDLPQSTLDLAPGFEFDRGKRRWVPAAIRLIEP